VTDPRSPAAAATGPRVSGWAPEPSRAVAVVQRAIAVVVVAQLVVASIARVPANRWSFYDPRPRPAALSATLGAEVLARFAPGPATVRAVGRGTMQFLRVPPPKTREAAVTIALPGR